MYSIKLTKKAKNFLSNVQKEDSQIILREIFSLRENPLDRNLKKLKGYKLWRMKIKKYRAILDIVITSKQIIILRIGFRKDIYKNFFKKKN